VVGEEVPSPPFQGAPIAQVCQVAAQRRPMVTISVNGITTQALVDTGAEISAISSRLYRQFSPQPSLKPSPFVLKAANGSKIHSQGRASFTLSLGRGPPIRHQVEVLPSLSLDCLLGADLLAAHGVKIDAAAGRLLAPKETSEHERKGAPLPTQEPFVARTLATRSIPALSEALVECNVPPSFIDKTVVTSRLHPEVPSPEGIFAVHKTRLKIPVWNPLPYPVTLDADDPLVLAEVVKEVEIKPLTEPRKISAANREHPHITPEQVDLSKLPEGERKPYLALLNSFARVFSVDPNDVGHCTVVPQRIVLKKPHEVAFTPQYPIKEELLPVVREYVTNLATAGIIQKSTSPFSSPLMLVRKASAKPTQPVVEQFRVVHDFRKLNSNTIRDAYPMRNLYQMIDDVAQSDLWSVVDLSSGFWNQELTKSSRPYTAFRAPGLGHWEYTRSPQGCTNSPATFQRLLDHITRGLPGIFVYMDDVIVCASTHDQMRMRLRALFQRFSQYHMKCRLKKLQLGATEVDYLGYNISGKWGIRPGSRKTQAIAAWTPPETIKQIKQFLGLCSFFRRNLPDFAELAAPLSALTRKDSPWSKGDLPADALAGFEALRSRLSQRPSLRPVNFQRSFHLLIQTTARSLKATLAQTKDLIPVAHASRILTPAEAKWSEGHRLLLAKVWGCKWFAPYLLGRSFTLLSSGTPLPTDPPAAQRLSIQRLQAELSTYSPFSDSVYKPREVAAVECDNPSSQRPFRANELKSFQKSDPEAKALFCYASFKLLPSDPTLTSLVRRLQSRVRVHQGLVTVSPQPLSPSDDSQLPTAPVFAPSNIRRQLLAALHPNSPHQHPSPATFLSTLSSLWFWPTMWEQALRIVTQCPICCPRPSSSSDSSTPSPLRLALPAPNSASSPPADSSPSLPSRFNQILYLSILDSYHDQAPLVLSIQDASSWFSMLLPLTTATASEVAVLLRDRWIFLYGPPLLLRWGRPCVDDPPFSLSAVIDILRRLNSITCISFLPSLPPSYPPTFTHLLPKFRHFPSLTLALKILAFTFNSRIHPNRSLPPLTHSFFFRPALPFTLFHHPDRLLDHHQYSSLIPSQAIRYLALTFHLTHPPSVPPSAFSLHPSLVVFNRQSSFPYRLGEQLTNDSYVAYPINPTPHAESLRGTLTDFTIARPPDQAFELRGQPSPGQSPAPPLAPGNGGAGLSKDPSPPPDSPALSPAPSGSQKESHEQTPAGAGKGTQRALARATASAPADEEEAEEGPDSPLTPTSTPLAGSPRSPSQEVGPDSRTVVQFNPRVDVRPISPVRDS